MLLLCASGRSKIQIIRMYSRFSKAHLLLFSGGSFSRLQWAFYRADDPDALMVDGKSQCLGFRLRVDTWWSRQSSSTFISTMPQMECSWLGISSQPWSMRTGVRHWWRHPFVMDKHPPPWGRCWGCRWDWALSGSTVPPAPRVGPTALPTHHAWDLRTSVMAVLVITCDFPRMGHVGRP